MSEPTVAKRSTLLRLIPLVVAGITTIVATFFVFTPSDKCATRVPLVVNSSTEKADLLGQLASQYNASDRVFGGSRCATVMVYKTNSGEAMEKLFRGWNQEFDRAPAPQVWTPTSSLWLDLLSHRGKGDLLRDSTPPSITKSVLSVAMPKPMADVLHANNSNGLGWSDILALSNDSRGWASIPGAKADWGRFKFARDNPHRSTSGLAATVASYYAATQKVTNRTTVTEPDLNNPDITSFVHGVESSVVRYSDDATEFMGVLYDEDRANAAVPHISAIVVQEQLAFLYNQGAPRGDPNQLGRAVKPNTPLVAIHPRDGTLMLNHPYVVLASATNDQRAAADDFRDFLHAPNQQRRFAEFGFRDLDGKPSAILADAVHCNRNEQLKLIDPPPPSLLDKMVKAWDGARRKARLLLILDVSGSMNARADPQAVSGPTADKSRLELVKPAAIDGINLLSDDDQAGLWTFSSGNPLPYIEQVPLGRVADVRQRMIDIIHGLNKGGGNTALYRTTRAAQQKMLASFDSSRINAVVLLSDGENSEPDNPDPASQDLNGLLRDVDASRIETSVRIFTIPYGKDDGGLHIKTLAEIAAASKAATYDASNPLDIGKVFVEVFRNL